ncbi:MAG: hypothetical protein COB05_04415 [Marinobacter sp.]|nr:MAG: hypothetical protein COB05_04415 [Marinobacter sp.]
MPIRIISSIDGFRRAGMAHPARPCTYPDDAFTVAQLAQLKAEPRLAVSSVQADAVQPHGASDLSADSQGTVEPDSPSDDVTGHLQGVVDPDGTLTPLEDMAEAEVRRIGKEMGIVSSHNMGLEKLIAKIKAEPVQVDGQGED